MVFIFIINILIISIFYFQNVLQVFTTHAANVFLLEVSPEQPHLLEEQVDICKRVLNIYRYMVMHTRMDPRTWYIYKYYQISRYLISFITYKTIFREQLLLVLLQITSLILTKTPPKRKDETLGGKIAPAIFQVYINLFMYLFMFKFDLL